MTHGSRSDTERHTASKTSPGRCLEYIAARQADDDHPVERPSKFSICSYVDKKCNLAERTALGLCVLDGAASTQREAQLSTRARRSAKLNAA